MELKDKIYVREFPEGINQIWDGEKRENTSAIAHHEFIRKDALLEWAEHMNELYPAGAFKMMIDKINSL